MSRNYFLYSPAYIGAEEGFCVVRYDFLDDAWTLVYPLLPPEREASRTGRPYLEHRQVMNGIFWGAVFRCSLAGSVRALW